MAFDGMTYSLAHRRNRKLCCSTAVCTPIQLKPTGFSKSSFFFFIFHGCSGKLFPHFRIHFYAFYFPWICCFCLKWNSFFSNTSFAELSTWAKFGKKKNVIYIRTSEMFQIPAVHGTFISFTYGRCQDYTSQIFLDFSNNYSSKKLVWFLLA